MRSDAGPTEWEGVDMELIINGEHRRWTGVETLEALVESLGMDKDRSGIAVALNDSVVPRADWPGTRVQAGDRIEIIHPVQGG
jgi:sulfur carrier protein